MKSRRGKTTNGEREAWLPHARSALAIAAVGLVVASPLVPSEGTIREGTYAPLAAGWCLLFVGWGVLMVFDPRPLLRIGWTEIAMVLFVGWHSLAGLAWLGHGNDRQTLNAMWVVAGYGLTVLVLKQVVQSARQARTLVAVMIWLAATLAAVGFFQYFVTMPALRAEYRQNPAAVLARYGFATEDDSPGRQLFENRLNSVEPVATFALTNSLAGFIAPWLVLALGIALAVLRDSSRRPVLLAAAAIAAALAGCLLLTKSRTAILAVAAGVVLLLLYGRPGGWRIGWRIPAVGAAALVVIGLFVVYIGGLDAEVLSEAPKSVLYRLEYWQATAALIADHPLLGCGPGNFQEAYAAYKLPQASEMVGDPHNFLLEVWATAGTPAIVLLLGIMFALAADLMRASSPPPSANSAAAADAATDTRTMYFGGNIVGMALGAVFAWLVGFPLDSFELLPLPIIWCVGLALSPLVWWLFAPWINDGPLPVGAVVAALLTLAINLLAAGSFVFPGVMLTALVLLPVAICVAKPQDEMPVRTKSLPGNWPLSRPAAIGMTIAAFALTVLCLWTEYQPVLTSRLEMVFANAHLAQGESAQAEQTALKAAQADPWAPEPWRLIAEIRFRRFAATGSDADRTAFQQAADQFQSLSPRHHWQSYQRGNWHLLSWQIAGKKADLDEALAAYREAVARYPNHALYHGQLAWALRLAGQNEAAAAAAERAHALDDAMPHADQKLERYRIVDWQASSGSHDTHRPETAELTIQTLRMTTKTEDSQ